MNKFALPFNHLTLPTDGGTNTLLYLTVFITLALITNDYSFSYTEDMLCIYSVALCNPV